MNANALDLPAPSTLLAPQPAAGGSMSALHPQLLLRRRALGGREYSRRVGLVLQAPLLLHADHLRRSGREGTVEWGLEEGAGRERIEIVKGWGLWIVIEIGIGIGKGKGWG